MIKHYIIPAIMVVNPNTKELEREPKYLMDMRVNWAGIYVVVKDIYLIQVNSSEERLKEIEKNKDVTLLDGKKETKLKLGKDLGVSIKDNDDEIVKIARLQVRNFKKHNLFVAD